MPEVPEVPAYLATSSEIMGARVNDPRGNERDVVFAYEAAERLASSLRTAAKDLDDQATSRAAWARDARLEWRGRFAEQFDERLHLCTADAREFARHLRDAASMVEELRELARNEQTRREQARQWSARQQDEWKIKSFLDWTMGTDKAPEGPKDPPLRAISVNPCAPRPS